MLYTIFQCKFSHGSDFVIWRLSFENIWSGHHQASFFSVNSVVTVILSSEDYLLKIYDMVITSNLHPHGSKLVHMDFAESVQLSSDLGPKSGLDWCRKICIIWNWTLDLMVPRLHGSQFKGQCNWPFHQMGLEITCATYMMTTSCLPYMEGDVVLPQFKPMFLWKINIAWEVK